MNDDTIVFALMQAVTKSHEDGRNQQYKRLREVSSKVFYDCIPASTSPIQDFFKSWQAAEDCEKRGVINANSLAFRRIEKVEYLALALEARGEPHTAKDLP